MASLGHERYCAEVVIQTDLLRRTIADTDLSVTVPSCPEWTLADLVRHIGGNLRACEAATRTQTTVDDPANQVTDFAGPLHDAVDVLDSWLAESSAIFADTLRAAGPDAMARMWHIEAPTAFWARRCAQDLVIHRADAAGALGASYSVAGDLAVAAVDELLELFGAPGVADAMPAVKELRGSGETIHLHATDADPALDAEWLIELNADGYSWRHGHEKATVALRAPLTDLLRVFYRRLPVETPGVEVFGDAALLDFWLRRTAL
jgi:uncharacterized protein (TIGR03083 family)